jgi:hypothetical protein
MATLPLIRARVVDLATRRHAVVLALPRLVCDSWSLDVLWRDIWTHYADARADPDHEPRPVPMQFADFAQWQAEQVFTDRFAIAEAV